MRYAPEIPLTGRDDSEPDAAAGSWKWTGSLGVEGVHGLLYICPCGCGALAHLNLRTPANSERPAWEWDGNELEPTLKPSIHRRKDLGGCGWHGFLRAGVWVAA